MIGQTISHYKILEKLGEGGMGVVYKAEDLKLHRPVALKFLSPKAIATEDDLTRFAHEAQAAAQLDHPNICTTYEIDEAHGQPFISMAYIEGQRLKKKIEAGPFSVEEALDTAVQIAEGLQAAHEKEIIHRDIKSANIMFTGKGQAKIMDFGLAKLMDRSQITKTGTTVGTTAYMSPEQARGEVLDHRTDIWSLGVVLYEMLTRQLPFKGDYDAVVLYSILNEEPKPMSTFQPGVPSSLEQITQKAMAKNLDERYHSVDEMLIDLKTLKKDIESGTVEGRVIMKKRRGKSRTLVYSGIIGIAALLIAIVVYIFGGRSRTIDSLAVLPFLNFAKDSSTEYLSDGITETLINSLSQLPNLKVIARSSVFSYKGREVEPRNIGHDLNVRAVLTGRVVQRGEVLSISTELADTRDDSHLWGESYNRTLADIFSVQQEIAEQIVEKLQLKLTGEEQKRLAKRYTENTEAYQLYLKGRYSWNKYNEDGFRKAINYFNQAIEMDPSFALAYAGLADAYYGMSNAYTPPDEAMPKARAAAKKALGIDETLAEAHTSLAIVNAQYEWNWKEAEKEYRRAIELNPGYAASHQFYGWLLMYRGQLEGALDEAKRSQQLDPLAPFINANVAWMYYMNRRYDESIEISKRMLEMDSSFAVTHYNLGQAYEQKSMFGEAIMEFQKARQLDKDKPYILSLIAHVYALSDNRKEAEKLLAELTEISHRKQVNPFAFALIYIGLGEKDQAFEWLDKAFESRDEELMPLKVDPRLEPLRSDSRYTAMLTKMGLEK